MAHDSKKWVRDWRGRLKRSRHRTQVDWQGELGCARGRDRLVGYGRAKRKCPQCRWLEKNTSLPFYRVACAACRRKDDVAWRRWHTGDEKHHWLGNAPKWFRQKIERGRRAKYRHHMTRARQNPDLYDTVPTRYPRNAAWLWW